METRDAAGRGMRRANYILLVDDDVKLCSLLTTFLSQHDFNVEAEYEARCGLARILAQSFDLVLLDVMLPVLDGFSVLRLVRQKSSVPVIMLTARGGQADRVAGLDAGADDYLPKPFRPEELVARIRAVLRRSARTAGSKHSVVRVEDLRIDLEARLVHRAGRLIRLTPIEFGLLEVLVRSAGRIVSRDELAAAIYQRMATLHDERALDVHVCHLRKKLEVGDQPLIRTVRHSGYVFTATTGS